MNKEGILKLQLFNLEKSAETLERIIYSDLTALESLPDAKAEAQEPRVLRKLERLDELQDEIDAVTAELKAAGWHESRSYSGTVYEYRPPKVVRPKPVKAKRKPRKVYPVESPTPAKLRAKKEAEKAAKEAEKQKRKAERQAAPKARRKPPTKPEGRPAKPRKPRESRELTLAKKRRDAVTARLRNLNDQIDAERVVLERRLEERKAYATEVANVGTSDFGPQKRRNARKSLENVETQLRDLPNRKAERLKSLTEQLANAKRDIESITANESQLI